MAIPKVPSGSTIWGLPKSVFGMFGIKKLTKQQLGTEVNGLFFAKVYIMITRQNCYLVECGLLPNMKLFTIFNLLIVANVLIEDSIGAKNSSRMKKLLKNNGHNGK